MNHEQPSGFNPTQALRLLVNHPTRWLVPAAAIAVLAGVVALVRPATWEASQALIVRNEASGNHDGPGNFGHGDQMKTVQETILELAKSRRVLATALAEVGPPSDATEPDAWPTDRDVADLRDAVKLTPPKGAEFGMTEVFYLQVRDHDRSRAIALAEAVCNQLENRFQQLRDAKAKSMIDELVKTVRLARTDLEDATDRMAEIEKQVGADLAELRILHDATTGEGTLRRTRTEITTELRAARAATRANEELLAVLSDASEDPGRLVATPNRLLDSQSSLRRLKEGLVDAQLRTAGLRGRMSDEHPLVQAAHESEHEIRRHLHNELATAIRGSKIELRLNHDRLSMLETQLATTTERLDQLAALRAPYSNRVTEVAHRAELLAQAERDLAEARASRAGAGAASLIARIDSPDAGTNPLGPGRGMIVLMGIAGGLLTGMGMLFISVPPATAPDRTAKPQASDHTAKPQAADHTAKPQAADLRTTTPDHTSKPQAVEYPFPMIGKPNEAGLEIGAGLSLSEALQRVGTGEPASF